jgi:hypothetical protein
MSHHYISKLCAGCCSFGAASLALSAHAQMDTFDGFPGTNALVRIPADTHDWTEHFRLGAMVGLNIKANFSVNGNNFPISGNNPAAGIFSDGYAHPDQSGDAAYTSNWGYDHASQISGNTLTMHSTSSFSTASESKVADTIQAGLDLAYGGNLYYWRTARVGWEIGFGWLPVDITDHTPFYGTATQTAYNFNTASLGAIVVPAAPYQGPASGTGPLIPLANTQSATTTSATVTGAHELDVSLFTLRLGPSIYWDLNHSLSLSVGVGPAVGFVYGQYKYKEIVTVNGISTANSGEFTGSDVVYGGYVNAALVYHIEHRADIYLGAEYMPMTDATISAGGRSGQLDLNGQVYISLGVNWPF